MTEYYAEKFQQALEYQDFILRELKKRDDMPSFACYASQKYQYEYGEGPCGLEIKFDTKFKETGNIFIEVEEKTDTNNAEFVSSGIMRCDNSWLYLIGNYEEAFILGVEQIICYCKSYEKYSLNKVFSNTKTSKGILFPVNFLLSRHLCLRHLLFSKGR